MLTLYHAPNTRSTCAHFMLHEIGEPFEVKVLNLQKGEHKSPSYLAINPMGKVPALSDGGAIITELPAILTYLADRYPRAGLAPAIDAPDRGAYLRWMFFNGSVFEPAMIDHSLKRESPARQAGWGTFEAVLDTLSKGLANGPWLLGERFSAADVLLGSGVNYMLAFKVLPERPEFVAYAERVRQRPGYQAAAAADQKWTAGG